MSAHSLIIQQVLLTLTAVFETIGDIYLAVILEPEVAKLWVVSYHLGTP